MKKLYIGIVFFNLFISASSFASKMVATVGGEVITSHDLQTRLGLLIKLNQGKMSDNNQTRAAVLKTLIEEKIYVQEAKKNGISVSEKELSEKLLLISKTNPGLPIKEKTIADQVKAQIYWAKLVDEKLAYNIKVSDSEIKNNTAMFLKSQNVNVTFKEVTINSNKYKNNQDRIEQARENLTDCSELEKFSSEISADKPEKYSVNTSDLSEATRAIIQDLISRNSSKPSQFANFADTMRLYCVISRENIPAQVNKAQVKSFLTDKKLALNAKTYLESLYKKTSIEIIDKNL